MLVAMSDDQTPPPLAPRLTAVWQVGGPLIGQVPALATTHTQSQVLAALAASSLINVRRHVPATNTPPIRDSARDSLWWAALCPDDPPPCYGLPPSGSSAASPLRDSPRRCAAACASRTRFRLAVARTRIALCSFVNSRIVCACVCAGSCSSKPVPVHWRAASPPPPPGVMLTGYEIDTGKVHASTALNMASLNK